MKKIAAIILSLMFCLTAVMFTGCAPDKNKIRLNEVTHSLFYAPLYIAYNMGYFKEYGLEIEFTNGGGATNVMTALVSGSADIGLMGPEATVNVQAQGQINYPIIFGQLTKRDGSFIVSKTDEDFKWENLKGKRLLAGRAGGLPAMTLEYVIESKGISLSELNFDTTVAFDMQGPTFASDATVDYTTLFEPTASAYEADGKGYVVASVGEASGEVPYTSFSATKKYIEENKDTIVNFLKAIIRGYNYLNESDLDKVADALYPSFNTTDKATIKTLVERYRGISAWAETPVFTEESYIKLQDIMSGAGYLNKRVAYTSAVDNTYAKEAIAKLAEKK